MWQYFLWGGPGHWGALLPHFTDEETGVREERDPALFKTQMGNRYWGRGLSPPARPFPQESPPSPPHSHPHPIQSRLMWQLRVRPRSGRGHRRPWVGSEDTACLGGEVGASQARARGHPTSGSGWFPPSPLPPAKRSPVSGMVTKLLVLN